MRRIRTFAVVLFGLPYVLVAVSNVNAATVYVGTNAGVFKSTDGGGTWTSANAGLAGTNVFSIAVDPSNSTIVYAGTLENGVYKSTDAGQNWSPANSGLIDKSILSLAIDRTNPQTLYAGTAGPAFFPGSGVFKTTNGGLSWTVSNTGLPAADVAVVRIVPSSPNTIYAGTNFDGVYKSIDAGRSWVAANTGMTPGMVEDVVIDPVNPTILYAGLGGCSFSCLGPAGVMKTFDGGGSWAAANVGITDLQIVSLAIDPANSVVLYAGSRLSGVFKTVNAAASWTVANAGLASTPFAIDHLPLAVDPEHPGTVLAGTSNGVFKSIDGGMTWTPANAGLPVSASVFAMAIGEPSCTPVVIGDIFATPATLWPPNRQMVDVSLDYTATSTCPVTCTLTVTSDQPNTGSKGDDWIVINDHYVRLRAERTGRDAGRSYTLAVACTSAGQGDSRTLIVAVPHDRR